MRGELQHRWVKFWVKGWLHGSIRWQLDPEERSVWADLICLAGECGQEGKICDNDGIPLPPKFIASQLNVTEALLARTIAKCKNDHRLEEHSGVVYITNWTTYQSEYDRQKPYRMKVKSDDPEKYTSGKYGTMVKERMKESMEAKRERSKNTDE